MDFDIIRQKFQVIKRVEVPRGEYSYDNAIKMIVELNDVYRPSWIYCDRGSGEYQIERLHIIGDQNPHTQLKVKVKGWQFSETIEVIDPVTKEKIKEPMKPFMINQLVIAFERERIMLSSFDEVLHKQLIDYEVKRISAAGRPVYTDVNEHFVDALGLAYLAFVMEFPDLVQTIKAPEFSSKVEHIAKPLGQHRAQAALRDATGPSSGRPWVMHDKPYDGDHRGDRPNWVQIPLGAKQPTSSSSGWGSRTGSMRGRSAW